MGHASNIAEEFNEKNFLGQHQLGNNFGTRNKLLLYVHKNFNEP